jgi:hypothetical protein
MVLKISDHTNATKRLLNREHVLHKADIVKTTVGGGEAAKSVDNLSISKSPTLEDLNKMISTDEAIDGPLLLGILKSKSTQKLTTSDINRDDGIDNLGSSS